MVKFIKNIIGFTTIGSLFFMICLFILIGLILTPLILTWLWNHVIINIFFLPHISFWQMLGLELFIAIIFKGIYFSFSSKS